jgi:hypothetical protein
MRGLWLLALSRMAPSSSKRWSLYPRGGKRPGDGPLETLTCRTSPEPAIGEDFYMATTGTFTRPLTARSIGIEPVTLM